MIRYKSLKENKNKVTTEFILNYVNGLKSGWGGGSLANPKWVLAHTNFVKKKIKLKSKLLNNIHMKPDQLKRDYKLIKKYADMKTPFPPIVIGIDKEIIDGRHRLESARLRGDEYIEVYQGVVDKNVPNEIRKDLWGY